ASACCAATARRTTRSSRGAPARPRRTIFPNALSGVIPGEKPGRSRAGRSGIPLDYALPPGVWHNVTVTPGFSDALSRSLDPGPSGLTRWPSPVASAACIRALLGETTPVSVKIKLKRMGKIHAPYYRIVVADARTKRDGRAIEEIGKYHPKSEPSLIEVSSERDQYWLSVGAQPTDPVRRLLEITGDWQKFRGEPGAEGTLR